VPVTVEFQPFGRRVQTPAGVTLLHAARDAGLGLLSICGGAGLCDSCRIRVIRGDVSRVSAHERDALSGDDLAAGYRLACQVRTQGDTVVDVPVESIGTEQRLQLESSPELAPAEPGARFLQPSVRAVDVSVPPPHFGDLRSDVGRLRDARHHQTMGLGVVNHRAGVPPTAGKLCRVVAAHAA
jgi:ferredoxin